MAGARDLQVSVERHEALPSTNDRALELARQGAPEGTVVVARTQTHGKGRRGRTWLDAPGSGLLMSVVLRPSGPAERHALLTLAAGTATAEAIRREAGVGAWTKWPNDVVAWEGAPSGGVRLAKVGGVLAEGFPGVVVVGIGVNLTQAPDVGGTKGLAAACLAGLGGREVAAEALQAAVLACLAAHYGALEAGDDERFWVAHRALDMTAGQAVTFDLGQRRLEGVVAGIGANGAIILQTADGAVEATAGEITLRPRPVGGVDSGARSTAVADL